MNKPKDKQEYIAKLENAISQKYGEETINNPRRFWDEDKEKEYIQQSIEVRQIIWDTEQSRRRRIFNKQKTT